LIKKENIFQPHRSHLYHLANEMGILMFFCIVYAVLQLGINGIIIYKATNGSLSLYFALVFLLVMTFVYLGIRAVIMRQVRLKSR
jgi:hypothetical protein